MGVRAQFRTLLRRPGNRMVLNWDLTPWRCTCLRVGAALSPRMPLHSANASARVDELMAGEALRGEGAAPTGAELISRRPEGKTHIGDS